MLGYVLLGYYIYIIKNNIFTLKKNFIEHSNVYLYYHFSLFCVWCICVYLCSGFLFFFFFFFFCFSVFFFVYMMTVSSCIGISIIFSKSISSSCVSSLIPMSVMSSIMVSSTFVQLAPWHDEHIWEHRSPCFGNCMFFFFFASRLTPTTDFTQ